MMTERGRRPDDRGGPVRRGVIDLLIGLSARCHLVPLLENHEEMLLAALGSEF